MHAQLPVTLVLTIRGALPLLLARLPRPAVRALRCRRILLPPPQVALLFTAPETMTTGSFVTTAAGAAASAMFPAQGFLLIVFILV